MLQKTNNISPILKWVGGKRQLLPSIVPRIPKSYSTYVEPFLGGGALLFATQPKVALVNDVNEELINVYQVVKDDVEELVSLLKTYDSSSETFYRIRGLDRDVEKYASLSDVERAARIIYLNKTCFNGLFRVNRKGQFNVPFGKYKKPNIVNESVLRGVSEYFNSVDITFTSKDYLSVLESIPSDSFVYLDPPYDPISETASFTDYAKGGFGRDEQVKLHDACVALDDMGIKFMLSNSATDFIKKLYADFKINIVSANRAVNSNGSKRGKVEEVIVWNYV